VPLRHYGSGNNNATGLLFLVAFTFLHAHTHTVESDTHTCALALSAILLACDLGAQKYATLAINFHLNYTHAQKEFRIQLLTMFFIAPIFLITVFITSLLA